MKIHVICCNAAVEFAVVEDEERAKMKMEELKQAHFAENRNWTHSIGGYNNKFFWHIHTVGGLDSKCPTCKGGLK